MSHELPKPGPIARRAVEIAAGYVGQREEGGNNRGPFPERCLASIGVSPGANWCAGFCRLCLVEAAGALHVTMPAEAIFPRTGWCPTLRVWAQRHGLWIPSDEASPETVKPGDLGLFWFPAQDDVHHVGIVEKASMAGVVSLEGNTGGDAVPGVKRDGDGVYRRNRTWGAYGARGGFARLPF